MTNRRDFIKQLTAAGTFIALPPRWLRFGDALKEPGMPSWLAGSAGAYRADPHQAALSWFSKAGFGLFLHYGLYSLLEQGEWVQFHEKIPVAEYEKLQERFTADKFDADFITDLAMAAGMKYVTLTAKHHDGFCLFRTAQTDYNSLHAAAGRDLVEEMKRACDKKGLGLFLYYSIAADWHHPYFYSQDTGWCGRPAYSDPQPEYLYRSPADFSRYIAYAEAQLGELATQYRPAGIWFDPIMGFYSRPDLFPMEKIYGIIRSICPHALISFKQGATGTEDFAAPERSAGSLYENVKKAFGERSAAIAQQAWTANMHKHNETCNTLQHGAWGYKKADDGKHKTAEEVLTLLQDAWSRDMNLLLNTGPLPDGSIYPGDVKTLRAVGKMTAPRI